ncbi:putative photosynthetic complex assembly protein PuhE [Thiocystis violascens]|uniref:Putative photosynthetic complex assembly protein 2 n=1 Tax=Thiocystis violascens (strain ATCC 17096 / DSM 198 / 6111) TaxID=765911 RepID=U3GKG5_THIV6|nr:putative photosynthetic complex assembly protein PuhE [Thiocystis violascens]AFL74347.1 putative photosynthetic complex assembly protein 2 [Thiocystis violascens DSM 198]
MSDFGFPILYALGLWWFSTGVVLYLDNLPGRTFRWTMLGGAAVLAIAIFGLFASSISTSTAMNYLAFTCGLVIWGVLEMSYFTGYATGPRKTPCPEGCTQWKRFRLAIMTSLYHELAIMTTGLLLIAISWGEPNQVGTWTFVVLWLMRWSAKLNLFLGVPNLNESWLPEHLRYLKTYMAKRGMNLLFPVSVTLPTILVVLIVLRVSAPDADGSAAVGLTLVATLLALAILEHWLLVLPLPDEALWAWALPPRETPDARDSERPPSDPGENEVCATLSHCSTTRTKTPSPQTRQWSKRSRIGIATGA